MKKSFFNTIEKINNAIGNIERLFSVIVLLLLVVFCMIFIICRFILRISTPWADEASRFVLIALAWVGASYCAYHDDHLRINALSSILKKSKHSVQILTVTEFITQTLVGVFLIFFVWNFIRYLTTLVIPLGVLTSALRIPNYYPMIPVVVGGVLMTIHSFLKALICLGRLLHILPYDETPEE